MKISQKAIIAITVILFIGLLSIKPEIQNQKTLRDSVNQIDSDEIETSLAMPSPQRAPMRDESLTESYNYTINKNTGDIAQATDKKVVKNGNLTLEVTSSQESINKISQLAEKANGFVQNSNLRETYNGTIQGNITIKIPEDKFLSTMQSIKNEGIRVINESTNANDVTERYTDLEARIKVATDQEQAYIKLLDKAQNVSELLEVQRELSNIRAKIESLQGQINYINNTTSYSSISIQLEELSTVKLPTKQFQLKTIVTNALQSVITIFQSLLEMLIWGVVIGVGVVLPIGLISWPIYKLIKKKIK